MRSSTLLTTLATASLSAARLTGLAAPSTIAPSQPFDLTLLNEIYIQAVADVSIAWGYSLSPGYPGTLGPYTNQSYLGPSMSNLEDNVTISTFAPAELEQWAGKEVVLAGSLFSLYGASGSSTVTNFNVTVKVGNETSDDIVASNGFWTP